MQSFGKCEKTMDGPLIVLREKRSKITFNNGSCKSIRIITIDGCVITTNEPRCDYLVVSENETENYVELKGSDVSHAVKQLEHTIERVSENPRRSKKYCFVISTRCPHSATEIQNMQLRFKKRI